MSSTPQRSSTKPGRRSLLYRDLASPVTAHRASRLAAPGGVALWRDGISSASASEPPPPPVFTLDDRADLSPEPELPPPSSPSPSPSPRSPPARPLSSPSSSFRIRAERSGSIVINGGAPVSPGSAGLWSPGRGGEKGKGSPVDGVVQSGALLVLPPPTEVVRPEVEKSSAPPLGGGIVEEEWVTVFGFSPGDTNLVLREFEKCGVILKHVPGPMGSNWMHILYQTRYDAQKALGKSGTQINSILIIGVKPVDPMHRQYLEEKLNGSHRGGFMVSLPPKSGLSQLGASHRPFYLQSSSTTTTDSGRRSTGAIATPSKSVVSKVMDLMFGI